MGMFYCAAWRNVTTKNMLLDKNRYTKGHHRSHTADAIGDLWVGGGLTKEGESEILAVGLRGGAFPRWMIRHLPPTRRYPRGIRVDDMRVTVLSYIGE